MDIILKVLGWIIASGLLGWVLNLWKVNSDNKKIHDKKIFNDIAKIINDTEINSIILKSSMGYLPDSCYWKTDEIIAFCERPQNEFIDKKTNILFKNFINDLNELA